MDARGDVDFNSISFEKKLTSLKDSQESINSCCQWCLANRQFHKKIVSSWLNVLKRVKIEQRLILFYLANDVIQYAKRRNYEFVESWGTTLQKATTMVRDEKIKNKVLRIFKIWEQRGVYGEEFISDLCGLISAAPSGKKNDEPHEFQSSYLIQKIKLCAQLELETDSRLKELKEHNPKIQIDGEALISSLKDRAHVDDVEKELDDYNKQIEIYINALKLEIKARIHLISLLSQAEKALDTDKRDVKTVTNAYKTFATRVKALKKKLDEKIPELNSPPPSPDINAPSPEPDSEIELPVNDSTITDTTTDSASPIVVPSSPTTSSPTDIFSDTAALYTNAGYYNPVPPPVPVTDSNSTTFNNHFSTFIGSDLSFNIQSLRTPFSNVSSKDDQNTSLNLSSQTQTTNSYNINDAITSLFPSIAFPPPPPATIATSPSTSSFQFSSSSHIPLQPPPMPPFSKNNDVYSTSRYAETFNGNTTDSLSTSYNPSNMTTDNSYPPALSESFLSGEEYNPEEELETWAPEPTWDALPPVEMDTPESPPMYEKAGYEDPIEYREGIATGSVEDVDHRILPGNDILSQSDVDHRNLISIRLSDSPVQDKDYRNISSSAEPIINNVDHDYRPPFNLENLKLPPPPPPPPKMPSLDLNTLNAYSQLTFPGYNMNAQSMIPPMLPPKQFDFMKQDSFTESMNLDESNSEVNLIEDSDDEGMSNMRNPSPQNDCFELPPPFPDLLDDVDANQFLDNVSEDFDKFDANDLDGFDHIPTHSSGSNIVSDNYLENYSNPSNPNIPNNMMLLPPWMAMPVNNYPNNNFAFQNFENRGGANFNRFSEGRTRGRGNWGFNRGHYNEGGGYGRRGSRGGPNFRGNRGNWNNDYARGRGRGSVRPNRF